MKEKRNCDVMDIKDQLKERLNAIAGAIKESLTAIDNEAHCLLSDFEKIGMAFKQMESLASSFYLQCYLSSFTPSFIDLSVTIRHLSERRHGALIVIERSDSLERFLHSGIIVGAALTPSLLESIFYPGSPLHDGAVLIRTDQIISAGNVLPISHAVVLDKKIGTRHRAAIGLTEHTDALVLVVSEETGNTSFAYKGVLHPIHDIEPALLQ
ncbi:sporulation-specific diadenylate cyclase CdaS [Paenibacillus filicis]|uniref:Diadenylate cyclase n=1 Tax=Paenibacillus gyeongsangnamensis TaxID=3388067 RepID=A0ABT4Q8Q7_9BACL|nr:sporulation-specific diadenylate cyclase CdaS [Paenibacillus filicis]MCZ8513257.1 sporulation-specific diadenylate cyclase CdaS [Paenibacillus filicis]